MNSVKIILALLVAGPVNAADPAKASFEKDILPVLEDYCYYCHGDGKKKGDLSLEHFKTEKDIQRNYKISELIFKNVCNRQILYQVCWQ